MRHADKAEREFYLRLKEEYPGIIDVHTHILPCIDDGSPDEAESLLLIKALEDQGITTVIATPHYDPTVQPPEIFLEKRARSVERFGQVYDINKLRLGAEVQYFRGISRMEQLSSLCVQGSNVLLLEMPTVPWTDAMLRETEELRERNGLQVIAAHIERYFDLQSRDSLRRLTDCGVKLQVNADSFLSGTDRRRLLRMFKNGEIFCIGSDCHGLDDRPPRMGQALAVIEKKLGDGALKLLENNCNQLFR